MLKRKYQTNSHSISQSAKTTIEQLHRSADFVTDELTASNPFRIHYYKTLVNQRSIHNIVLRYLKSQDMNTLEEVQELLPVEGIKKLGFQHSVQDELLRGNLIVVEKNNPQTLLSIPLRKTEQRAVEITENEFTVLGPKEAFIEALDVNINLIRKQFHNTHLIIREQTVGSEGKNTAAIMYVETIASKQNVNTMIQRLEDLSYDEPIDVSQLGHLISDNPNSPFAQLLGTERPDRVLAALNEGKVVTMLDGSPMALIGPTNLYEFFSSPDDNYVLWPVGSFIRMMRIFGVLFSVISTSLYIAITTYHHELIPNDLLTTMISSRIEVPYPPIVEVLFLEITIELLREGGARLPNRIGQTIGIVGGIVIGTAVVEASLASSVLLIIVSLTALASFTTPTYQMGNTIRLIRFPFILFSQWLGFLGISICSLLFLVHLLNLKSLGNPYMAPIYPFRWGDLRNSLAVLPVRMQNMRPSFLRPQKTKRFSPRPLNHQSEDIEE
ncbi:spore germination protein [Geomicrobium sp. JCM 19039]|uniref:spore germination protein n=1 Tax=Geomicrobium sp. JCM 19039 TaxID=1460636 RepID=UPI00187BCCE0|nr:spore germination protein [Geomicrobium sp. JCM 19039]